ncbi:MAG TPA: transketolase C-terminal domain-containing protein [Candidatus Lokiarchaeia archaeon]|nr:transketolase C-terminal domain-containing protein [Candidatus Lokiarchaeia archaeon]
MITNGMSLRERFGDVLSNLGDENEQIVVLDADLSASTMTCKFGKKFPDRFFNAGIAEQNMMGMAMGLASTGKIPIVSGFTCFTVGRAWEFIKAAAYDDLAVKICTTHSGLSSGKDGGTHQSLEDLSLIASIPNTRIYCPCDPSEIQPMLEKMIAEPGVGYLRLMRNSLPLLWKAEHVFSDDFIETIQQSSENITDITIFSTGSMSAFMPEVISILQEQGLTIHAMHVGRIKPLLPNCIEQCIGKTRLIVTVEEHNVINGFGAQLSRLACEKMPARIITIGIDDKFGQSGSQDELYEAYGLKPCQIANKISDSFNGLQV